MKRRHVLTGLCSALAMTQVQATLSQPYVDGSAFGLTGGDGLDQSQALQMAIEAASELGQPLYLPGGTYAVQQLSIRRPVSIIGSGDTVLRLANGPNVFSVADCEDVLFEGLTLEGSEGTDPTSALLDISNSRRITVRDCRFARTQGIGIRAYQMQGTVRDCGFEDIGDTAIFSTDSFGLDVLDNTIDRCGNGAIRIWRNESGADGSRIAGNRISEIDWVGGGNGQNGNGVNIFRADDVSVTDNHFSKCAFSAVRLNATKNCRVNGNFCLDSGEVSIFSEFGFSGSIISNNVVEGGAAGISMTNFDQGGRQSICQGNIVRNLATRSLTNPDTIPFGIAAEADAVVTGNIVESVPGTGISVGWGPYLRDVLVSDNLVRDCTLGIVVSVAPDAGYARISGNIVSASRQHGIVGAQWQDIVSADLPADAGNYPGIDVEGNRVL